MGFVEAYAATAKTEGGYVNDPQDPGGETYCGISRRWHPRWEGWKLVDVLKDDREALKASATLSVMVKRFFYDEFWLKLGCDEIEKMSPAVAFELYDSAVNLDRRDATRFLQEALNVLRFKDGKELYPELRVDGRIGAATIEALRRCLASTSDAEVLILNCMNGEQYIFYKQNPQHKRYRGWFARV
jgi:lysozyme family protein